jgi:hypothetical protein
MSRAIYHTEYRAAGRRPAREYFQSPTWRIAGESRRSPLHYGKRMSGEGLDPVLSCVECARQDHEFTRVSIHRRHTSR